MVKGNSIVVLVFLSLIYTNILHNSFSQDNFSRYPIAKANMFPEFLTFSQGILYLNYDMLISFLGDNYMNQDDFSLLIERYFIPTNIKLVGLSVGWEEHANTTLSDIPYYQWIDDFLSITDLYDIGVFFHFGSFIQPDEFPSWLDDVIKARPELKPYFENNTINPQLIGEQLKEDLKQLYQYYGKHVSWIGVAFGCHGQSSINFLSKTSIDLGFDNTQLYDFYNSDYNSRDVDVMGYHIDGTKCKLNGIFKESESLLVLSSGCAQGSSAVDIFGERKVAFHFIINETLEGFKVSWYGNRIGNPGNLRMELYNQTGNPSYIYGESLETVAIQSDYVKEQPDWQLFVNFKSTLKQGIYSILYKAEAGDNLNLYRVYFKSWATDDSISLFTEFKKWDYIGGGILWIKDLEDNDKLIYPYQHSSVGGDGFFRVSTNTTFNFIFVSVSDRPYDPSTTTIKIVHVSNGQIVAKGTIRPEYTKGMYYWVPVPLESDVKLIKGEYYDIIFEYNGTPWQTHCTTSIPATAGFQGKSRTLLFKLAYLDPIFVNFMRIGPPGRAGPEAGWPGAEYTTWWAQRYNITKSAPLLNIEVNIEKYGEPGDLIVRLREDDGTGQAPGDKDIDVVRVPVGNISEGRTWVNVSGWNTILQAGKMYWILLTTTEAPNENGYWPWKIEYAYEFLIKRSDNSGKSWVRPHEPAELYIKLKTGFEAFTVEPETIIKNTYINDRDFITQSFILQNDATVYGYLLYLSRSLTDRNGILEAEIRMDSGHDSPSSVVLTSGKSSMIEKGVTFKGLQYFDFSYPCSLQSGVKYWLVLKANSEARIEPVIFAFHDPELSYGGTQLKVKVSSDNGLTWLLPDNKESDLIFGLIKSPINPYRYITEELVDDIEKYHTHEIWEEPLRGWNVYTIIQTSKIQKELIEWFISYTGRKWFSLDSNPSKIIQEVDGEQLLLSIFEVNDYQEESIGQLLEFPNVMFVPSLTLNNKTPDYVKYYKLIMPIIDPPITLLDIESITALNCSKELIISDFWNISKRMVYPGQYYGKEGGVLNVLFMGDQDSSILARNLMSITNISFIIPSDDYNFTKFHDFNTFNVIVYASNMSSMDCVTSSAQERIKDFVRKGGGFVVLYPWVKWADELIGLHYTDEKVPSIDNVRYANYSHIILKPYLNITKYIHPWENRINPISSDVTYVVKDANNQPLICTNKYGSGRSVLYNLQASTLSKMYDGYMTILINSIFYAGKNESRLPVLYYGLNDKLHNQIYYSISGKSGGPILLWLTNNGTNVPFEIHLNATYYGLDRRGWIALNIMTGEVYKGIGTDICIKTVIPAQSWEPIYILNQKADLNELYSNTYLPDYTIYPGQSLYTLTPNNWTSYLIIRSLQPVAEVWLNDTILLPHIERINGYNYFLNHYMPPINIFNKLDFGNVLNSWYYDFRYQLLYIKLTSLGSVKIRVIQESALTYHKYQYIISFICISFIILEIIVYINNKNVIRRSSKTPMNPTMHYRI